jgi:hypothetical protein
MQTGSPLILCLRDYIFSSLFYISACILQNVARNEQTALPPMGSELVTKTQSATGTAKSWDEMRRMLDAFRETIWHPAKKVYPSSAVDKKISDIRRMIDSKEKVRFDPSQYGRICHMFLFDGLLLFRSSPWSHKFTSSSARSFVTTT